MEEQIQALKALVLRHARGFSTETPIPRVELRVGHQPTGPVPDLYQPMLCCVLQGTKRASFGNETMEYRGASYLIATVQIPVRAAIVAASAEMPYLALSLRLSPSAVGALLMDLPAPAPVPAPSLGVGASPLTPELTEPVLRLLRLLDAPHDIPVLAPLIEREILYRLLHGPQADRLRQIGGADARFGQIRQAIARIRAHFAEPLRIDALAEDAGMSPSTLHRHFKAVTAMSPLQYQKAIRLQEARHRLLAEAASVGAVAHAVGYQSPSQFSREYARQFGHPPARDVAARRDGASAA